MKRGNFVQAFQDSLNERFWEYVQNEISEFGAKLDRTEPSSKTRPPVFTKEHLAQNLIAPPENAHEWRQHLLDLVPERELHRHFGSMKSSQAVALSVFGGLKLACRTDVLAEIKDGDGVTVFSGDVSANDVEFEHAVNTLGEPRPTSIDVMIDGQPRVMIECKFTEGGVGACSRPKLTRKDKNYERDNCDGSFRRQRERKSRCSLSEVGVRYWDHIPELLPWDAAHDIEPCPLRAPYQIVRNVLASVVCEDGTLDPERGHAVLVYDERNPAFRPDGEGMQEWEFVKRELRYPALLRRCSWQEIASQIRTRSGLDWLSAASKAKYGI